MARSSGRFEFDTFAQVVSHAAGRPGAFVLAFLIVLVWGITGPLFHFSDTWQLVINTGTTVVTFLMVFLIQHTQNRDTAALHLKMDELIRVTAEASNALLDLEAMPEKELDAMRRRYQDLAHAVAARQVESG